MKGSASVLDTVSKSSAPVVSDEELVERSLKGEEEAFRYLHERYRQPVYAVVFRIIRDPEEARDITQDIFITLFQSLNIWDSRRAGFLPWALRIAANRAIDHLRKRQRRAEVPLTEMSETGLHSYASHHGRLDPTERMVHRKERAVEVRRLLESLPVAQKRFILMRYWGGLKMKEIAEEEGCKLGTVKSVLHRATIAMRFKLHRLSKQSSVGLRNVPLQDMSLQVSEG